MASETHFGMCVKGCAEAAYKINESRNCVVDLTSILLETQDNMRQIHMLNHVLGIRAVVPAPPAGPASRSPRPRIATQSPEKPANSGDRAATPEMYKMASVTPSPSRSRPNGDLVTAPIALSTTTSSRTFTPVSTMQRLAHSVRDDLPMDVVATNALDFVAAWHRADQKCAAQEDVIHESLSTRHTIERAEQEGRWRLQHLLLTVTEQLHRFVILGDYGKFVVFCMENEPVWRQAARQLQKENDARLNTTANIFARFLSEDDAVAEKTRMYQEAADFVVSLCLVEREQRSIALTKAMARRRRQSASQVVTPTSTPWESRSRSRRRQEGESASAPAATAVAAAPSNGTRGHHKEMVTATQHVTPLTSVEVDNYREGWRAVMGHLTNGERGRVARSSDAAAAAPAKNADDKKRLKSPPPPSQRDAASRSSNEPAAKSKAFVFPTSKEEKKSEEPRRAREDKSKDKGTPLPPVSREEKKQKGERAVLSPSPPSPKSKEDGRGHRHSSRDNPAQQSSRASEEAAARKVKTEAKVKEARPVAVSAAAPHEEQHHHHRHRDAKARS